MAFNTKLCAVVGTSLNPREIGFTFNDKNNDLKLLQYSVGFAVENSDEEDIKLVKVKLSGR